MSEATLQFIDAGKTYGGKVVLDDVSLTIEQSSVVALVGHNGAGKTTMMKLLLGLIRPSRGQVKVLGADPAGPDGVESRRHLGFLPETISFQGAMTGLDAMNFYARLKRVDLKQNMELLDRVGLADAARMRIKTYSKGMRQRLGLAQAMLGEPKVLLLDEPTTGLDPQLRRRFYDTLSKLKNDGATILLSSHALSELETRIEKVAIMKNGRLIANGSLHDLRNKANIPVRMRLLTRDGSADEIANQLAGVDINLVNGRTVEFSCAAKDKMMILRRVSEIGVAVEDVEIQLPSLDQLYSHYRDEGTVS